MVRRVALLSLVAPVALAPGAAQAQGPAPEPFRADDFGGFMDILPPGANGTANPLELGAFLTTGARPPNNDDQLAMYGDLAYAVPGVTQDDVGRYFKDSSFGVRPEDVARTYSPRDDVTIVRDRSFGVPHVYGRDRVGAMFGLGYAGAEDRLFFMDVLRNSGRGRLSSFAGGSAGNRAMDADQWAIAPYNEADLTRQYEQFDDLYGERAGSSSATSRPMWRASTATSPRPGSTRPSCPASTPPSCAPAAPNPGGWRT